MNMTPAAVALQQALESMQCAAGMLDELLEETTSPIYRAKFFKIKLELDMACADAEKAVNAELEKAQ